MTPSSLSAQEIAHHLWQLVAGCGDRCTKPEMDAVEEAIRRVRQHELLVRDVLPDLRRRLAGAEG